MEQDENTIELAKIIMSDILIDESILYGDVYYHKDECVKCEHCEEFIPEEFTTYGICEDCADAEAERESLAFDCRISI